MDQITQPLPEPTTNNQQQKQQRKVLWKLFSFFQFFFILFPVFMLLLSHHNPFYCVDVLRDWKSEKFNLNILVSRCIYMYGNTI